VGKNDVINGLMENAAFPHELGEGLPLCGMGFVTKTIVFAYREIFKTLGFQKRPILSMFFVAM
jgi:hypothetical protein